MPAVRTSPKDVLIRVPKVEPYSNRYVPPLVRAKEAAKKAEGSASSGDAGLPASAADPASTTNTATAATATPAAASDSTATTNATATGATATTTTTAAATTPAEVTAASTSTDPGATDTDKPEGEGEGETEGLARHERGNSPTIPFLSVDREEGQTVELSKAATSSAGWNSLLVWARRQRGAQWDESTALWQVDKYSREYYSFCEHPSTTDRSKQPGDETDPKANDAAASADTGADADRPIAVDEDDDKGPTRISSRNKVEAASPPPVAVGRSARLSRK